MKTPQTWTADNGDGTFSNPLFYDEFSDPDLIRVGDDFYLTGTTMHAMPGLPVLHSKDLVNWRFLSYACDRLDFGPEYRLENGKEIYGQGVWAPSFRWHKGVFYIFTNVRGQPMQVFRATDPAGPWTRTTMRRGFHDPSVLFDDDGKIYVVWGYRDLRLAQLNPELTDTIPGTERVLFKPTDGMGEGAHFTKIDGKYYITSAWYLGTMKMPCARADRPEGPYEVRDISGGEDFGVANGAMHQGGIVRTPAGEWWGFSMMDFNSLGRLTGLSPVTWQDGWPYFGLPGNLGRSPRTWVKPKVLGAPPKPSAPYARSDSFDSPNLAPVWQWNHAPDDARWSLTERPGFLRLHALPATDFWRARNTLTQRAIGPVSTATAVLETEGMADGAVAGLGLLNAPYAWIGARREGEGAGVVVEQFDQSTGATERRPVRARRLWLRAACDFLTETARFFYSADGRRFTPVGAPFKMVFQLKTFQGVRYSLFHYGPSGGFADFDALTVDEPRRRQRPIPYGKRIVLTGADTGRALEPVTLARVGPGRVALLGRGADVEIYQWIETPQGEVTLLALATGRYLGIDDQGRVSADHAGPRRRRPDPTRFTWKASS